MTKEEMQLTAQVEALRTLVAAMEKTIQAQKETISALEKRVSTVQEKIVYVPAPAQTQPVYPQPIQQPYIGDPVPYKWGTTSGGITGIQNGTIVTNTSNSQPTIENSAGKAKMFLSAFTLGAVRGISDSRI